jgi:DNA-binding response OmpR family regulator
MMKRKVLLVEDDPAVAESTKVGLETHGEFGVDVVSTGCAALRSLGTHVPDAILLAATLSDVSGFELCHLIRSRERTAQLPVIMIGDRQGGIRPVDGLEMGADDYVAKPFNPKELEARLKAVLRRHVHAQYPDADRFVGVHLDANFTEISIEVDHQRVRLTKREFLLLRFVVHKRNQVLGRDALLASAWGSKGRDRRIVDSAIYKLRAKLCQAGRQIETVTGFGYRFNEPPK